MKIPKKYDYIPKVIIKPQTQDYHPRNYLNCTIVC